MLGPADVGHRVVVRRVVGGSAGRPLFTDLLGELAALTPAELTIVTRRGTVVVPRSEVHRAKRVPARRRVTTREILALERVAAAGWPAPETDRLGAWLLRAAGGWTSRGNSALATGDPGLPLPAAVDAVVAWYAGRGLVAAVTTPLPAAERVAAALAARGWRAAPPVLVQTAPVAALLPGEPPEVRLAPVPPEVHLECAPSDGWLAVVSERKGGLPAAARHILTAVPQVRFAHGYDDAGELCGVARGVVTDGWLGVSLMEVAPAARRRGVARRLLRALAGWAARAGADRAYLQVEEDNQPAVALYASAGFTTHHTYVTYRAPSG
ncbi:MAG TPA: GNAT family N-acetyltransferase [Micromonosporaceae bacterium]|nr:GNAT family N-acetyltransferase [Micromonosporaceae bacterium]